MRSRGNDSEKHVKSMSRSERASVVRQAEEMGMEDCEALLPSCSDDGVDGGGDRDEDEDDENDEEQRAAGGNVLLKAKLKESRTAEDAVVY